MHIRWIAALSLAAMLGTQAAGKDVRRPPRVERPTAALYLIVNGTALPPSPPPIVVGARVLVPIAPVFSALAITVSREGKSLVANVPSATIRITVGSAQAKVNNRVVQMDAPVSERNGSTYVALRFIADALGAVATYDRQSNRIQIVSSLVGRAAAMSQAGPAGETTVTGVVSAIDQNSSPVALTVVRGSNTRTISVGTNVRTTIQDVTTHTTIDGTLAQIHVGDSVSVRIARDGTVLQLLDLYASRSAKVIAVSGSSIVLSDGHVVTPSRATTITLNGDQAQLSDLASGDAAIIRSNPETGEAREILASRAAATPAAGAATAAPAAAATASVAISSFTIDARRPLHGGESFDVAMAGTPGARATYDIGSFVTGLPMRETQPGTYTARYSVGGSINFASVPVYGYLSAGPQSAKAQAPVLLSVATLPPQIVDVAPSQNQSVNNSKPSIYATFSAPSGVGINPNSASISVNGADVTGASTRTESFITYGPNNNVGDGPVNVTVRVSDLAGNVATRSWSFTIRSH
jgi:hypothetical protein